MYTFFLSIIDYLRYRDLHWFMLFMFFILFRWAVIFFNTFFYRPYKGDGSGFFTTVIIPVVDEDESLFRMVLERILCQSPDEVIVVINGPENPGLTALSNELFNQYPVTGKTLWTPEASKRNAIRLGLAEADSKSEITLLVDSDTLWEEHVLNEIVKPFAADPKVGGVTTRQKIWKPGRSLATIFAGILEEIRAEGTMKAMSVYGEIGCLPGRTIAFRTAILRESMKMFMTEKFMGIHKEVSDDRSLTNLTLQAGWKTVMQDTAVVFTDAPTSWKKFFRQQLRWAEGSQYNNLRMTGWMFMHARLMVFIFWTDMLMPFLLMSVFLIQAIKLIMYMNGTILYSVPSPYGPFMTILLILAGSIFGFGSRNIRIMKNISLWWIALFPVIVLVLSLFIAPIRLIGLARCADGLGWGTRDLGDETKIEDPGRRKNLFWRIFMRFAVMLMLFLITYFAFQIELL